MGTTFFNPRLSNPPTHSSQWWIGIILFSQLLYMYSIISFLPIFRILASKNGLTLTILLSTLILLVFRLHVYISFCHFSSSSCVLSRCTFLSCCIVEILCPQLLPCCKVAHFLYILQLLPSCIGVQILWPQLLPCCKVADSWSQTVALLCGAEFTLSLSVALLLGCIFSVLNCCPAECLQILCPQLWSVVILEIFCPQLL